MKLDSVLFLCHCIYLQNLIVRILLERGNILRNSKKSIIMCCKCALNGNGNVFLGQLSLRYIIKVSFKIAILLLA